MLVQIFHHQVTEGIQANFEQERNNTILIQINTLKI